MAFADGEYLEAWARSTTIEARQRSIWMMLASQEFTGPWVDGAAKVTIPVPTWTNAAAASRDRGANWKTANDVAETTVEFSRNGGQNVANEVLVEDALEIPWPLIDGLRSRQGYELSKGVDEAMYSRLIGANGIANADTVTYGTAGTNFISRTSPYEPANDASRELVFESIDNFHLKLERADALTNGEGDSVGQKYVVMPPEIFRVLRDDMLERKYSWDPITASILEDGGILTNADFQGRLMGIDIFSWNGIAVPTGTDNWTLVAGCRAAVAADVRTDATQVLQPSDNQVSTKPAYLAREAKSWGLSVLTSGLMAEISIHAD